jgi:hypothetical protein
MRILKRIGNYFFGIHRWYQAETLLPGMSIFKCYYCNKSKVRNSWWCEVEPVDTSWFHKDWR